MGVRFDAVDSLHDLDVAGNNPRLLAKRLGCLRLGSPDEDQRFRVTLLEPCVRAGLWMRSVDEMALCRIHGGSRTLSRVSPSRIQGLEETEARRRGAVYHGGSCRHLVPAKHCTS